MNKKITAFLLTFLGLVLSLPAKAICPVCTVAAGAGLGLSRYLGIDDTVTGLWLGAFTVSLITWTINWLKKKNYVFRGYKIVTTIVYYAMLIAPLVWNDFFGHPLHTLWGIDKLILGVGVGTVVFLVCAKTYFYLKAKNDGRAHFPFEKVVLTVLPLIILSVVFYYLTRY